jgi:hypothetical protein
MIDTIIYFLVHSYSILPRTVARKLIYPTKGAHKSGLLPWLVQRPLRRTALSRMIRPDQAHIRFIMTHGGSL